MSSRFPFFAIPSSSRFEIFGRGYHNEARISNIGTLSSYLDRLCIFSVLMLRGDSSVRRIMSAVVKSLSSRASRNFCSRIRNRASTKDAASMRGMQDRCSSALSHSPARTATRNSDTSSDSVLYPDSLDSVLEA